MKLQSMVVALVTLLVTACSGGGNGGMGGGSGGSGGSAGSGGSGGSAGSGGSGGGSGTITVAGTVVDNYGVAIAGATVVVIGKPSVTTSSTGAFSVPGVIPPYDVSTVSAAGSSTYIAIYKQVTRADPTLIGFAAGGTQNMATITGSLSGSGVVLPTPVGRRTWVSFSSNDASATNTVGVNPYSMSAAWTGPATATGTVHALQLTENASGVPTGYIGYGKLDNVLIATGNTAMMKDVALTAVTEQLLSGSVTVPSMLTLSQKAMAMYLGSAGMPLASERSSGLNFAYPTPAVTGATFTVAAYGSTMTAGAARRGSHSKPGLAANATGVALAVPTPPGLSLPVQAATGIALATQAFSWSPMEPAGLHVVQVTIGTRYFVIITNGTSATLPPTTELGLGTIPTGTAGRWQVTAYKGGAATVDAFTGLRNMTINSALTPPNAESWYGESEERSFTTN